MKKSLKILLLILGIFFILFLSVLTYVLIVFNSAKLDKNKLINMDKTITYYDKYNVKFAEESSGVSVTDLKKIPEHVKNAFIAIEDKRFLSHNGVDYRGLFRAFLNNAKSFSFKEGASTISQQLIKNTHLSNEKTLKRKLIEIKLAKELEKNYSKDEILEKYLNTIYFGNGCYGITSASNFYFNKSPELLDINEGATLAAIIKAPSYYSPLSNIDKTTTRKNLVLSEMKEQGYISNNDYIKYKNTPITTCLSEQSNNNFLTLVRREFNDITKNYPYKYKNLNVYTSLDCSIQQILESEKICNDEFENANIVLDKNSNIVAFNSTCKIGNRQPGSTLKPLLVYAPAIETDAVFSCTPILDEKTDFNGYSPSNYNDQYYGYVSVKDSLAKSLNTCAVKILNYVGVDRAVSYLKKTDMVLDEKDNSLCLALGATTNGVNIIDLTSAYSVFLNKGYFYSASCINKITTENSSVIFAKKKANKKIFSSETIDIVNDMMLYTATNGTAKKLSYNNFPIYAKTGTVGSKNGNSDAYSISYTSEYVLTSWCGNNDKNLMSNNVTGGNQPTKQASNIWKKIYYSYSPSAISQSENICEEYIDKISYERDHVVKLADVNAPLRYKEVALFKKSNLPKERSTSFTLPKVENAKISVENNIIKISLCVAQSCEATIYKHCDNKKFAVFDTANNDDNVYIDKDIKKGKKYKYSIIPYFKINDIVVYGEEIFLEDIKIDDSKINEWWKNELE